MSSARPCSTPTSWPLASRRHDRRGALPSGCGAIGGPSSTPKIAKHRKTLDSLVDQARQLESAALIEAVDRRAKELEGDDRELDRQRDTLIAGPGDGLTDAEATAIQSSPQPRESDSPRQRRPSVDNSSRRCGFVAAFLRTRKGCCLGSATASGSNGRPGFRYCILRRAC